MNRTIRYAIDLDSGEVVSQVGSRYAWPILDYEGIGRDGDFTGPLRYDLEIVESAWRQRLYHTNRIPTETKNLHRAFWGMSPVGPIANEAQVLDRYWKRHRAVLEG